MDAATLTAAAAAITSPRTTRSAASVALAIAVDDSKTNMRILKTLATALQTALGLAGYLPALVSAGERMLIYDEINKEYIEAMDAAINLQELLPYPTEGCREEEIDEQAQLRLYAAEAALQMAAEEHACREYGPKQTAMMRILDQINFFGPRLRIYPVCRAKTATSKFSSHKTACGISFPNSLWTRPDTDDYKLVCKINWTAFIKELQKLPKNDPIQRWAEHMHHAYGSHHNWPEIGCGASFYPNMDESTMVAEVQCENGTWEAFTTDPLPMELADEIKQEQANEYLPSPQQGLVDCNKNIPFSPPMTHLLHDLPIIARYPLEEWERSNRPSLSVKGWCKLAMIISIRGMSNIQCCFDVSKGPKQRSLPRGLIP